MRSLSSRSQHRLAEQQAALLLHLLPLVIQLLQTLERHGVPRGKRRVLTQHLATLGDAASLVRVTVRAAKRTASYEEETAEIPF